MSNLSNDLHILAMQLESIMGTFEYDQADEEFVDYLSEALENLKSANRRLAALKRLHNRQEGDL